MKIKRVEKKTRDNFNSKIVSCAPLIPSFYFTWNCSKKTTVYCSRLCRRLILSISYDNNEQRETRRMKEEKINDSFQTNFRENMFIVSKGDIEKRLNMIKYLTAHAFELKLLCWKIVELIYIFLFVFYYSFNNLSFSFHTMIHYFVTFFWLL
jgi:hypothetical protein